VDLTGVTVNTALEDAGRTLVLTFSSKLPDFARYLIQLTGIRDTAGNALAGDRDRILTALLGDATGDGRVNNSDVGGVLGLRGIDQISLQDVNEIRSDVTNDGRVNNSDVGGVLGVRGKDARFIADPTPPIPLDKSTQDDVNVVQAVLLPLPTETGLMSSLAPSLLATPTRQILTTAVPQLHHLKIQAPPGRPGAPAKRMFVKITPKMPKSNHADTLNVPAGVLKAPLKSTPVARLGSQ